MQLFRIWFYLYLLISLTYCFFTQKDVISHILFTITVAHLVGILHLSRTLIYLNVFILSSDYIIKLLLLHNESYNEYLDFSIISNILKLNIHGRQINYIGLQITFWITFGYFFVDRPWKWGLLTFQVSYYTTPVLLYCLVFFENNYLQYLALISFILFILFPQWTILSKIIIVVLFSAQYTLGFQNSSNIYFKDIRIAWSLKIGAIISLQFYENEIIQSNQHINLKDRISNQTESKRYLLRRKLQNQQYKNYIKTIILYIVTVALALLTTGVGNIFIVFALYLNLPNHKIELFKRLINIGVIVSLFSEPQDIVYVAYILVSRQLVSTDINFKKYSYAILITLGRVYTMLSHVSVINFLLGLFGKPFIVCFALCFKIICRYLGKESIFMGTNQSYGFETFFSYASFSDTFLWLYLILLLLYSPKVTPTFSSSNIPDIFTQYSIFKWRIFESCLNILKVYHWLAYFSILLTVLYSEPSIFSLITAIILFLIIATDIISKNKSKHTILYWLWKVNIYTTFVIAFMKYFYLFRIYQQKDPDGFDSITWWVQQILNAMHTHSHIIGLKEITSAPTIWTLIKIFLKDFLVIIHSLMMVFIMDVKIFQDYREIIQDEQRSMAQSSGNIIHEEGNSLPNKNLHYLYINYVKPIHFQFQNTYLTNIISYYLVDIVFFFISLCFLIIDNHQSTHSFTVVSSLLKPNNFIFQIYLPFFLLYSYYLYHSFQQLNNSNAFITKVIMLMVGYSCMMILFVYVDYVWSYVSNFRDESQVIQHKIEQLIVKLLILMVSVIAYEFSYVAPPINIQHYEYTKQPKEIIQFTIAASEIALLAIFIRGFFNGESISFIARLIVIIMSTHHVINIKHHQSRTHLMMVISVTLMADLWLRDSIVIVGIVIAKIYSYLLSLQGQQSVHLERIEQARSVQQYSNQQVKQPQWRHLRTYETVVFISIYCISLLIFFSTTFFAFSLMSTGLFVLSLVGFLIVLFKWMQMDTNSIFSSITIKIWIVSILIVITIYYLGTISYFYFYSFFILDTQIQKQSMTGLAIGLSIFWSGLGLYFLNNITFKNRYERGVNYWLMKSQLLRELGSQLHNQKKLNSLRTYFLQRQNHQERVVKLLEELKYRKIGSYNQLKKSVSYNAMENEINRKEYELYSNMLIVMSVEILVKCYYNINMYLRLAQISQHHNPLTIANNARNIREHIIYLINNHSLPLDQVFLKLKHTFKQYQKQLQLSNQKQQLKQGQFTEKQLIQIQPTNKQLQSQKQKISQQGQKRVLSIQQQKQAQRTQVSYSFCFQLIHQASMKYPLFVRKIIQNSQMLALMIVVGWNFFGGVYTIPINLIIFSWAIVLQNKTTVTFWLCLLAYSSLIAIFKIVLSLSMVASIRNTDLIRFLLLYNGDNIKYEMVIIGLSAIQIMLIHLGGTTNKSFSETQSIYDSFYRYYLNKYCGGQRVGLNEQQFFRTYLAINKPTRHHFFYRVFSKSRFKPGKDYYPLLSCIQLAIFIYIFFFYDSMEYQSRSNQRTLGQKLKIDKFSSNMIIALSIQMIIMVFDRFIVSLNIVNKKNQQIEDYFLAFSFGSQEEWKKHPSPTDLSSTNFFDYLLIIKYLFHVVLLILINFLVYFYIPSAGLKKNLIPNCKSTNQRCQDSSYTYLSILLFLYLLYFVVSGLQIKHGFNRNKCRNTLMQKYHYMNYYLYVAFTFIPFLWQFKKICDWTLTSTALPLFHWMKFEDINARLYQSKCQAQMLKLKKPGIVWYKYIFGPIGFLSILLLVFSPLIIYSAANPFAIKDKVIGASLTLTLKQSTSFYQLFETSHMKATQQAHTTYRQMYRIIMSMEPDYNFMISEPALNSLIDRITTTMNKKDNSPYSFILSVKIIEELGGQKVIQWSKSILSNKQIQQVVQLLNGTISSMIIENYFSPLPGTEKPKNIQISTPNKGEYFKLMIINDNKTEDSLYFYYLTSSKFQIGVGVATFYLTYVFLISGLVRFYFTGYTENIIYEGCKMEKILVLCEGVRSARMTQNFREEQCFYFQLMDLMRAPKHLKDISGSFEQLRAKILR